MSSSKTSNSTSSVSEMKREFYEKRGNDKDTDLDITNMSKKLTQDLRKDVNQNVKVCRFLSREWMIMADTIARLGKISSLEATSTELHSEGKNAENEDKMPTLWECGEIGIRYLVEDGKMNLLLKVLFDFKESERELKLSGGRGKDLVPRYKFELGIGQTFLNAWRHSEVIQIMDVPFLLSYIAQILTNVIADTEQLNEVVESMSKGDDIHNFNQIPNSDFEECENEAKKENSSQTFRNINLAFRYRQEYLVIIYLGNIIEHSEETMHDGIGFAMRENNIFELMVSFISLLPSSELKHTEIQEIVKTLNLICSTEDFQIYQKQYLTSDAKVKFQECHERFICAFSKKLGFQGRKLIRPLLDAINS